MMVTVRTSSGDQATYALNAAPRFLPVKTSLLRAELDDLERRELDRRTYPLVVKLWWSYGEAKRQLSASQS